MRRNPLLYSDHGDIDEPLTPEASSKKERSWLFYFIILANFLLVLFVLGIIWFLFLKSPDLHIKELTERFFGTQTTTLGTNTTAPEGQKKAQTTQSMTQQQQDEIQQTRLRQMREQEEQDAERQRLEKIRVELEAERAKADTTKKRLEDKAPADKITTSVTPAQTAPKEPSEAPQKAAVSSEQAATPEAETTPAIVPNAATETPQPDNNTNTVNTQVDQIMETLKQQQKAKEEALKPQNDSRAPKPGAETKHVKSDTEKTINLLAIEKQLEALIESEELKSNAEKLLQQAEDLDKEIRINQKLSILQANAV